MVVLWRPCVGGNWTIDVASSLCAETLPARGALTWQAWVGSRLVPRALGKRPLTREQDPLFFAAAFRVLLAAPTTIPSDTEAAANLLSLVSHRGAVCAPSWLCVEADNCCGGTGIPLRCFGDLDVALAAAHGCSIVLQVAPLFRFGAVFRHLAASDDASDSGSDSAVQQGASASVDEEGEEDFGADEGDTATWDAKGTRLSTAAVAAMALALAGPGAVAVQTIVLGNCAIGAVGATALSRFALETQSRTSARSGGGEQPRMLDKLLLHRNTIGDAGATALAGALATVGSVGAHLSHISLHSNNIRSVHVSVARVLLG